MKPTALERPAGRIQSPLWGILGGILFVAAILGLLVYFGAHEQILRLLEWFDAQGAWVSLLFILVMATVVVLVLPGVLFTTGAGFVFGVIEGSVYVVIGTTLGAVLAFLIARYLFGQRLQRAAVIVGMPPARRAAHGRSNRDAAPPSQRHLFRTLSDSAH